MQTILRHINRYYAALLVLAALAVASRLAFTSMFWIPRFIRHHLADFGFPAFITAVITIVVSLISLLVPTRIHRKAGVKTRRGLAAVHLIAPLVGTALGLNIEREDYYRLDEGDGFDPGKLLDWLQTPNTDTFDWWDVVAIILGGLLAFYLQWQSTRSIRSWRRFPLFLVARSPSRENQRAS